MNHEEKAEMYRRQLGGTNAALNRSRQRCKDLEKLANRLYRMCIDYGADHGWETGEWDEVERMAERLGVGA